jgi:hypothetical protein
MGEAPATQRARSTIKGGTEVTMKTPHEQLHGEALGDLTHFLVSKCEIEAREP